mmetsp:Transcript_28458/g.48359  ORF Transcript_28458/g.48359 Transcript_28458/m.48359 type:complete len:114 (+) Transcript_28458:556-897(+)
MLCLSGACNPNNLAGFNLMAQTIIAYTAHTPSCMVATVMVNPLVLPPTAFNAAVLYSLYFIFPAYQNTKNRIRATESGAPLKAMIADYLYDDEIKFVTKSRTMKYQLDPNKSD